MDLDLQAVATFLVVVERRHFGHAANDLGISVSAVTKRIQRLEASLGVPLVERDSGGFAGLTPAGWRFVQFAPQIVQATQTARLAAVGQAKLALRVAVPAGVEVVAPLMPAALATLELALSHTHPGVTVALVPTPFAQLTPDLIADNVDVVLTFGPSADPSVTSTRLGPLHRVGLVGAKHPFAYRRRVDAREFARQPMVYAPGLPDEYMNPFVLADVRPLDEARLVPVDASNTAHVAQRVLEGREVTVIPAALSANLPRELKRVELDGVPTCWYYAHRRADDVRPELLTMIDLLVALTESITRAANSPRAYHTQ
jgi:DNA-binding transcriptional LysR family regulator